MTVLKLVDATKQFGGVTVVNKVSVAVEPGKVQVLLGENGAGKSTIIKMMSGVYQPDGGHIEIDGKTVTIPNVDAAKKFGIAVIHQELTLVPQLTVWRTCTWAICRPRAASSITPPCARVRLPA